MKSRPESSRGDSSITQSLSDGMVQNDEVCTTFLVNILTKIIKKRSLATPQNLVVRILWQCEQANRVTLSGLLTKEVLFREIWLPNSYRNITEPL